MVWGPEVGDFNLWRIQRLTRPPPLAASWSRLCLQKSRLWSGGSRREEGAPGCGSLSRGGTDLPGRQAVRMRAARPESLGC